MRSHSRSTPLELGRRALSLVLPTRCLLCDRTLGASTRPLCQACDGLLVPITPPLCWRCGQSASRLPRGFPGDSDLCTSCSVSAPIFAQARSCWSYEDALGEIIPRIKYGRDLGLLRDLHALSLGMLQEQLQRWVDEFGPLSLAGVPMHDRDLFKRGFNQSAMLAKLTLRGAPQGVSAAPTLLKKTRRTAKQAGLNKHAREQNLRACFALAGEPPRVLVILDDVFTTGVTASSVASAALEAGVETALVLTLARKQ